MRPPSDASFSLVDFCHHLLHRRRLVFRAGLILIPIAVLSSYFWPLRYESQLLIERKPPRLYPVDRSEDEFALPRLTSETQHTIALVKSRYLMERWLENLGAAPGDPRAREKAIQALEASVYMQPISYTDMLILKVRAASPEEARTRLIALSKLLKEWDIEINENDASRFKAVLEDRQKANEAALSELRSKLLVYKSHTPLRLLNSKEENDLESQVAAREKVGDQLAEDLDGAERRLAAVGERFQVLAPATLPYVPLVSRYRLMAFSMGAALLGVLLLAAVDHRYRTGCRLQSGEY